MAFYEAGVLTQAPAATADKPYCALWHTGASTNPRIRLREFGFANTSATACKLALKRITARGTQTATLLGEKLDANDPAAFGTVDFTYSADPTVSGGYFRRWHIPAVIGAGGIWSFWSSPSGLVVPNGAGIAAVVPTAAAGQILEVWFVWEED